MRLSFALFFMVLIIAFTSFASTTVCQTKVEKLIQDDGLNELSKLGAATLLKSLLPSGYIYGKTSYGREMLLTIEFGRKLQSLPSKSEIPLMSTHHIAKSELLNSEIKSSEYCKSVTVRAKNTIVAIAVVDFKNCLFTSMLKTNLI